MVAVGVLVANLAHLVHDLRLSRIRRQLCQRLLLLLLLRQLGLLLLLKLGCRGRCEVLAREQ